MVNTKSFVLLIGEKTRYLYKFVRWEIQQALKLNLPIIGVNINKLRQQDPDRCPPIIRDELAIHISYNAAILQYSLENWENKHYQYKKEGKSGPYYYKESVYTSLGI